MFNKIKLALYTFLQAAFGIKMSYSASLKPNVVPTVSEPIEPYCQRLLLMMEAGQVESLRSWRVTCVKAYKSKSASRHEYVSAAVTGPGNKEYFFAIERGRGNPDERERSDPEPILSSAPTSVENLQPQKSFSSSEPSLTTMSSVSDSIFLSRPAKDMISPLPRTGKGKGKKDDKDELIYQLNIERVMYFYELAVVALVVHEAKKSYLLLSSNCYYYAGTIMKVLEVEYETLNVADGASAGKWCGIDIVAYSGTEGKIIASLRENIKASIKAFDPSLPVTPEARKDPSLPMTPEARKEEIARLKELLRAVEEGSESGS